MLSILPHLTYSGECEEASDTVSKMELFCQSYRLWISQRFPNSFRITLGIVLLNSGLIAAQFFLIATTSSPEPVRHLFATLYPNDDFGGCLKKFYESFQVSLEFNKAIQPDVANWNLILGGQASPGHKTKG